MNNKLVNQVLCLLAFASFLIVGIQVGEIKIKNQVTRDCENGFTEIDGKGIYCSMRSIN